MKDMLLFSVLNEKGSRLDLDQTLSFFLISSLIFNSKGNLIFTYSDAFVSIFSFLLFYCKIGHTGWELTKPKQNTVVLCRMLDRRLKFDYEEMY